MQFEESPTAFKIVSGTTSPTGTTVKTDVGDLFTRNNINFEASSWHNYIIQIDTIAKVAYAYVDNTFVG